MSHIPQPARRVARSCISSYTLEGRGLVRVYGSDTRVLIVPPVTVRAALPKELRAFFWQTLQSPDSVLLSQMSTSPAHEGPAFVSGDLLS